MGNSWFNLIHPSKDINNYIKPVFSKNKDKSNKARSKIRELSPMILELTENTTIIKLVEFKNQQKKQNISDNLKSDFHVKYYIDLENIIFRTKNGVFSSAFTIHNKKSNNTQLSLYGRFWISKNYYRNWKCRIDKLNNGYMATVKIQEYPLHKKKYTVKF